MCLETQPLRRLRQEDCQSFEASLGRPCVSVKVSISVIKCHDQMQLGEDRGWFPL